MKQRIMILLALVTATVTASAYNLKTFSPTSTHMILCMYIYTQIFVIHLPAASAASTISSITVIKTAPDTLP